MTKKETHSLCYSLGIFLIGVTLCFLNGCATQGKSVGLGGALGAGTGAVLGGIVDPGANGKYRTRNVVLGAALGGVTGIVAGSLISDSMENQKKEAYDQGKASSKASQVVPPRLQNPTVETRWVDSRVVGNRYIEGHFEFLISEPARWEDAQ
jgi:hypothetical protein